MRLQKADACLRPQPGRFFHIVVELNNTPGALCNLLRDIEGQGITVLNGSSYVDIFAKTAVWSAFVRDSDRTVSELRDKISSAQHVLDSMVVESKGGFLSGGTHFSLSFNANDRTVLGRNSYFERILRRFREKFGSVGEAILYDEGYAYGKDVGEDYARRLGTGFARANLQEVLEMYETAGWFRLEGVERCERYGLITIRAGENFECEGAQSGGPYSQFVRGHLSGGLTAIMGRETACEETKCIAAGDQSCEFVLNSSLGIRHPTRPQRVTA